MCHYASATVLIPPPPQTFCLIRLKSLRYIFEIFDAFNVNHASCLAGASHKLLGASINHSHLSIARVGEIVQEDVGHGGSAVALRKEAVSCPRRIEVARLYELTRVRG